jgi:hypothetical protein
LSLAQFCIYLGACDADRMTKVKMPGQQDGLQNDGYKTDLPTDDDKAIHPKMLNHLTVKP